MKNLFVFFFLLMLNHSFSQKKQDFILASPDGKIEIKILVNDKISWTISHEKDLIFSSFRNVYDFG
jgi:alpha-glucosidase